MDEINERLLGEGAPFYGVARKTPKETAVGILFQVLHHPMASYASPQLI